MSNRNEESAVADNPVRTLSNGLPSHWRRTLAVVAALAMAAYILVIFLLDREAMLDAMQRMSLSTVVAVFALSLINYALRFLRWQHFISRYGYQVPVVRHLLIYMSGFVLTLSPGKVGEGLRSVYLQDDKVPIKKSLAALVGERYFDLLAMVALAMLIFAQSADQLPMLLLVLAVVCGTGLIMANPAISRKVMNAVFHLPVLRQRLQLHQWLDKFVDDCKAVVATPWALVWLAMTLIAWGAEGVGVGWLAADLGYQLSHAQAIGIYSLGILAGVAAFMMPGGLGGTEAAMTALLVVAGLTLPDAVIVTLLCRLATLWFAILLGIVALAILEMNPTSPVADNDH